MGCAGRVVSPITRSKAAEHVRCGLRASAEVSALPQVRQQQELVVVGVRIALRAHHLPLPRDDVVDRDGDLTALLRVRTVPAKVPPIKLYASVPRRPNE